VCVCVCMCEGVCVIAEAGYSTTMVDNYLKSKIEIWYELLEKL